jgi:hypothetical protein
MRSRKPRDKVLLLAKSHLVLARHLRAMLVLRAMNQLCGARVGLGGVLLLLLRETSRRVRPLASGSTFSAQPGCKVCLHSLFMISVARARTHNDYESDGRAFVFATLNLLHA